MQGIMESLCANLFQIMLQALCLGNADACAT
jgi:hypothetical protein